MALETMSGEKRTTLETSSFDALRYFLSLPLSLPQTYGGADEATIEPSALNKLAGIAKMTPVGKMRDTLLFSKHKNKEGHQENIEL